MRFPARLRTPLSVFAVAALGAVGLVAAASPAQAALHSECRSTSISCITFAGYRGHSVWGYPVNSQGNNCVNYAVFRIAKNGVRNPGNLGNAGSWASRARAKGFRVDHHPAIGAIAQWSYGSAYAPSNGHVGYVEEVTSKYIAISDSNWSGSSRRFTVSYGDRNFPSTFIHFRDVGYQPPPSGSFLRVRENGQVYRLVGRTPVYVSSWRAFGGAKATYPVASSTLARLPRTIANGTVIVTTGDGKHYRIVGGAPVRLTTYRGMGRIAPALHVDKAAVTYAGRGGVWSHLNRYPVGRTYVSAVYPNGAVATYAVTNGAASLVRTWASVGGQHSTVRIPINALVNAGLPGEWSHIRSVTPALR